MVVTRRLRADCNAAGRFFALRSVTKICSFIRVLRRRGMLLIGWTARGFDTGKRRPEAVAARICKQTRPGTIVLLHEGHQIERDPKHSVACVELTLRRLSESGYRFVIPASRQLRTNAA